MSLGARSNLTGKNRSYEDSGFPQMNKFYPWTAKFFCLWVSHHVQDFESFLQCPNDIKKFIAVSEIFCVFRGFFMTETDISLHSINFHSFQPNLVSLKKWCSLHQLLISGWREAVVLHENDDDDDDDNDLIKGSWFRSCWLWGCWGGMLKYWNWKLRIPNC